VEDKPLADSIYKWSRTAADNDDADSAINWLENQLPDTVNDSTRAVMMRLAELRDDLTGNLVTAGTQPAYTITTAAAFDSLAAGRSFKARVHATNTAAATLNANGLGAKSVRKFSAKGDLPVEAGDLQLGGMYDFTYSTAANGGAGGWVVDNPAIGNTAATDNFPAGTAMIFVQAAAPVGWTKSTAHNDKALRIVAGGSGGSAYGTLEFSIAFASRTPAGTVGNTTLTAAQIPYHTHTQAGSFLSGLETANHTHTQQGTFQTGIQSANHTHDYVRGGGGGGSGGSGSYTGASVSPVTGIQNQDHSHSVNISGQTGTVSANHQHWTTISGETGAIGGSTAHTHTFTGTAMDFTVKYVDAIICTKD
jgi:hypothetical protein